MSKNYFISIIIPCNEIDTMAIECIDACLNLSYPSYEILILPTKETSYANKNVTVLPTPTNNPCEKRNLGVSKSKGEILAFIDSDAYPKKNWLERASRHFKNIEVGAVGGPNLTPPNDPVLSKASGEILSSLIGSGNFSMRYSVKTTAEIDDLPSCNLLILKKYFYEAGGFDLRFWPGEDSLLCYNIHYKSKKKIVYDPEVIVYHHRRPLFLPHLSQIWRYGKDGGYQLKKSVINKNSSYTGCIRLIPSLFVLSLLFAPIIIFINPPFLFFYIISLSIYIIIICLYGLNKNRRGIFMYFLLGTILTHISFGTGFLWGMVNNVEHTNIIGGGVD